jgi:hypothetical protein
LLIALNAMKIITMTAIKIPDIITVDIFNSLIIKIVFL